MAFQFRFHNAMCIFIRKKPIKLFEYQKLLDKVLGLHYTAFVLMAEKRHYFGHFLFEFYTGGDHRDLSNYSCRF